MSDHKPTNELIFELKNHLLISELAGRECYRLNVGVIEKLAKHLNQFCDANNHIEEILKLDPDCAEFIDLMRRTINHFLDDLWCELDDYKNSHTTTGGN